MEMDVLCDALGNRTRYQLVKAMQDHAIQTCCDRIEFFENGVSVGDVVNFTGLAQSTVSQHLAVLLQAGLIRREKRNQWSCYFLNRPVLDEFLTRLREDMQTG
jgi:DNA-binding transcriptional ArsR family regulator